MLFAPKNWFGEKRVQRTVTTVPIHQVSYGSSVQCTMASVNIPIDVKQSWTGNCWTREKFNTVIRIAINVADGSAINRRFFDAIHRSKFCFTENYTAPNPCDDERVIYICSDTSHLLKVLRSIFEADSVNKNFHNSLCKKLHVHQNKHFLIYNLSHKHSLTYALFFFFSK